MHQVRGLYVPLSVIEFVTMAMGKLFSDHTYGNNYLNERWGDGF